MYSRTINERILEHYHVNVIDRTRHSDCCCFRSDSNKKCMLNSICNIVIYVRASATMSGRPNKAKKFSTDSSTNATRPRRQWRIHTFFHRRHGVQSRCVWLEAYFVCIGNTSRKLIVSHRDHRKSHIQGMPEKLLAHRVHIYRADNFHMIYRI